jgi:hypothetical protein
MERLFTLARELASPQLWSTGVELARNAEFQEDSSSTPDDRIIRVIRGPRDRIYTVTLSVVDELWSCDCGSDDDPCCHVVGAILAFRQGKDLRGALRSGVLVPATVVHVFKREGQLLAFHRELLSADTRELVTSSLAHAQARLAKGNRGVSLSEYEGRIDQVVAERHVGILEPRVMRRLIPALSRVPHIELDGVRIRALAEPLAVTIEVVDDEQGFRIRRAPLPGVSELFDNGVAIRDGALCAVEDSALSADDVALLRGEGAFFGRARALEVATRVVPQLQAKVRVVVKSNRLPRARKIAPRILLETIADSAGDSLTVVPRLIYGDPVIARVVLGSLEVIDEREVPIRDAVEEARLVRDLATRLGLRPNEARVLNGEAAVHFTVKIRGWATTGSGAVAFTPAATLLPTAQSVAGELNLRFNTEHGKEASAESVVEAWGRGARYVRLIDGGWGALPTEWLAQHGDALVRLLSERRDGEPIPAKLLPEVADICDSLGIGCPDYFARLREALHDVESIPAATLPGDLTAQLRPYQRTGVNWLAFLRDHRLGALLADDMGLGKTLQTMCVLDHGALIVCPTSVLSSWREQLARFRTSLRVSTYHGPQRVLDSSADVVLTSYAILRLDREKLSAVQWNTVVLDEAQTIRNPMSQVAQAAFNLTSIHSISLSGTPIENSVDDLWSQFHFLNRGLLGSYREFQDTYGAAIRAGDISVARTVHKRVAPFILRRLKRTVAKELPPKTEVVLECELDEAERSAYEAVLAGTKSEVLRLLDQGEGVFSILEVLLRLRQACCHRGLLPGHSAESSTKVDLLLESLKQSAEMGHRALVFSQWTSMLDRIEPHLESAGISFSRIDGSTEGREEIVQQFQSPEGPTVMLLSLKAGGLGITLTSADHVYIVDPWWNPAVEDQAADRAYRIGQENPVIVHRLVARGTIEERILELQQRKRAVMEAVVGGAGGEMALSRSELLDLLDAGR